ncbi:thymidine kinase [Candidatus Woesearchaeota archaeon]|nr:thymidine kinase [Candidatus Woesearchaeota archaeon]
MGELQLIVGCMYAGKTEELMRRARKEYIAGRNVAVFKPSIDTRYSPTHVASHNRSMISAHVVQSTEEMLERLQHCPVDVVVIDEIQFFSDKIIPFCVQTVQDKSKKVKILASCLSRDFRGEPFKFLNSHRHIGELMPHASAITVLRAICTYKSRSGEICGRSADYTQRLINSKPAPYDSPLILVGSTESYEARCSQHHHVPGRKKLLEFFSNQPSV